MDKDFEDYKKKLAEGAYPEAEQVEEDVRQAKERNADVPEEALRKLKVSAIAALKRIRQWRREVVSEDLAEPMIKKLFAGNLECGESVPPIPTPDDNEEDEEAIAQKVRDIEQHEKAIMEREKQFEEMERLVESIRRLRAERKKKEQQ